MHGFDPVLDRRWVEAGCVCAWCDVATWHARRAGALGLLNWLDCWQVGGAVKVEQVEGDCAPEVAASCCVCRVVG